MKTENILSRHQTACISASNLFEAAKIICEQLNSCDNAEDALETAGTILGDVTSLSGLATLLIIDIDALIKSCE